MIKNLLPIGSIVLLKNAKKRVMIYGIKQTSQENKEYDYIGVFYPEGNISEEYQFLFNHEDIAKIFLEDLKISRDRNLLKNWKSTMQVRM